MSEDDSKDFNDLLNEPASSIPAPKPLPTGTWEFVVVNGKIQSGKVDGKGPKATGLFQVKPVRPTDDVSEVELSTFGDYSDAKVFHRINMWELPGDRYQVIRFLIALGMEIDDTGLADLVKASKGYHFLAVVTHRANAEDPENPFVDLKEVRPVE